MTIHDLYDKIKPGINILYKYQNERTFSKRQCQLYFIDILRNRYNIMHMVQYNKIGTKYKL